MITKLSYFHLVHCLFIFRHGWLHSNQFCKTYQNWFCSSWRCLHCMMAFAGAFTTKQQFMHPHCIVQQTQNLDEDSFDMLYNDCWAAIPDPILMTNIPYERKINMLSSTDNNFMIFLFDFERFWIESQFLFFHSHYLLIWMLPDFWRWLHSVPEHWGKRHSEWSGHQRGGSDPHPGTGHYR